VQLDWSLDNMQHPGFGRNATKHNIIDLKFLGFGESIKNGVS
jgi:hypothetical protein